MNTLTKVNIAVATVLVLGFGYFAVNTHNPAPATPIEIIYGTCKTEAPYKYPAVPCEKVSRGSSW